jgi:hypothetical protein
MRKLIAAIATLALTAPVALAAGNTATHYLKVSPSTVKRGKTVRVYGSVAGGCGKGGQATLFSGAFKGAKNNWAGVPAVYAKVGKDSKFSVKVKISKKVKPGKYSVGGRCGGGNFGSATLKVKKGGGGSGSPGGFY